MQAARFECASACPSKVTPALLSCSIDARRLSYESVWPSIRSDPRRECCSPSGACRLRRSAMPWRTHPKAYPSEATLEYACRLRRSAVPATTHPYRDILQCAGRVGQHVSSSNSNASRVLIFSLSCRQSARVPVCVCVCVCARVAALSRCAGEGQYTD